MEPDDDVGHEARVARQPPERDGALLATLRAYFAADCSQKEAAQLIPVHHKTLRYRLDKIEELTGLDLTRHSERMRASIALDLLALQDI
jgi:DNA-binding PucR family transcriptional regulator